MGHEEGAEGGGGTCSRRWWIGAGVPDHEVLRGGGGCGGSRDAHSNYPGGKLYQCNYITKSKKMQEPTDRHSGLRFPNGCGDLRLNGHPFSSRGTAKHALRSSALDYLRTGSTKALGGAGLMGYIYI